MRLSRVAALSTAAAIALAMGFVIMGLAIAPAEAQQKKRVAQRDVTERITVVDESGRVRTRITVRPRSFLDPGKETLPFAQHYHDYATQPLAPRALVQTNGADYRYSLDAPGIPGPWPGIPATGVFGR